MGMQLTLVITKEKEIGIELQYANHFRGKENVKNGGKPFGAIITRNNEEIAIGVNEVIATYDITKHAELVAIQKATQILQTSDLSDCTIYASGECCPMCLTAIYFAKINKVFYSYSSNDEERVGLGTKFFYDQLSLPREQRQVKLEYIPRDETTPDAFALWEEQRQ